MRRYHLASLIVFVAIFGSLAGFLAREFVWAKQKSRTGDTFEQIYLVHRLLDNYRIHLGNYPEPFESVRTGKLQSVQISLADIKRLGPRGELHYLKFNDKEILVDAWGNEICYRNKPSPGFWSAGPNGEDEITAPDHGDDLSSLPNVRNRFQEAAAYTESQLIMVGAPAAILIALAGAIACEVFVRRRSSKTDLNRPGPSSQPD